MKLAIANVLAFWQMRKVAASHWYSMANTVLLVGAINVVIYFAFFERPWLTYENLPFPVLNGLVYDASKPVPLHEPAHLRPGDPIALDVHRCNSDSNPRIYNIARELRGPLLPRPIILKSAAAPINPGCSRSISDVNQVPKELVPGTPLPGGCGYWIAGYAEVPGYLRTSIVRWSTETFCIDP